MATLRKYKCNKCGYEVKTEPQGHFGLMLGEYYNFSCHKCKEIISLSANSLSYMEHLPKCPNCHEMHGLWSWNPIEGHCPKCNGQFEMVKGYFEMVD